MKKRWTLFTFLAFFGTIHAQFGSDVAFVESSNSQVNTEIATAFNGWLFSATSMEDVPTDQGGIKIRKSVDGGQTWSTVDEYFVTGVRYPSHDIVVTGTDSASLKLVIIGVNYNTTSGNYSIFVDNYDPYSGVFLGNTFSLNKGTSKVHDVQIATDGAFPAVGSSPFSVGFVYSCFGFSDSIISYTSIDGGLSYGNRSVIATTLNYTRDVSIDYGRSSSASNGRYFVAWEVIPSSSERNGNIYTSRNTSTVTGGWIPPENLDSLSATMIGLCRNPRISTQRLTSDNDSAAITALVTVDRDYTGDGSDYDVLGFYNMRAHYTNFWYRFDIFNNGNKHLYSDVIYDNTNDLFQVALLDSSVQNLLILSNSANMVSPSTWTQVNATINDTASITQRSLTRIVWVPTLDEVAIAWIDTKADGRGIAKIDAESFETIGLTEWGETDYSLFPNPVATTLFLIFDQTIVEKNQHYCIYDLNGRIVAKGDFTFQTSQQIDVSAFENGVYVLEITNELGKLSKRFVKE